MTGRGWRLGCLMLVWGLSCGGPRMREQVLTLRDGQEVVEGIRAHARRLKSFQGWGEITVVTPEQAFRGGIRLAFRRPDSLWVKVEGPLGIDVLQAVFHGESALLYYPADNVAYKGRLEGVLDRQVLPVGLESTEKILRLLGLFVPEDPWPVSRIEQQDGDILIVMSGGHLLRVDTRGPLVKRYVWHDDTGRELAGWEGARLIKKKRVYLPRLIRMAHYEEGQRVNLLYERIVVNRSLKSGWCDLVIPKGVDIIEY